MVLLAILSCIALVIFIVGFFLNRREGSNNGSGSDQMLVWMIDTILWFVWAYLAYNEVASNPIVGNSYISTAIGLLGAGFILVCVYKDITVAIEMIRSRPHTLSPSEQYEEDKKRNHQHIYNITRRRY